MVWMETGLCRLVHTGVGNDSPDQRQSPRLPCPSPLFPHQSYELGRYLTGVLQHTISSNGKLPSFFFAIPPFNNGIVPSLASRLKP